MKTVSDELGDSKPRSAVKNPVALELGLRKDTGIKVSVVLIICVAFVMTEKDRFTELLKDIGLFASNEIDANDFEDKVRELFWTSGYIIFTVDKLIQALVKQVIYNHNLKEIVATGYFGSKMCRALDNLFS